MWVLVALLSVSSVSGVPVGPQPPDCSALYTAGETRSGIYSIYPAGRVPVWVYCQMESGGTAEDNGGWTVIQRRVDGSVNFYRRWAEYSAGFGVTEGEHWLGLENMYQLTRDRKYTLRVDLEDCNGRRGYAQYSSFSVGPESGGYRLQVSGFTDGGAGDSLSYHDGQKFSTLDRDQDVYAGHCARLYLGAFWYKDCHTANPNGVYLWGDDNTHFAIGDVWYAWSNSFAAALKSVSMRIRRA